MPFRSGIGVLARESNTAVLPVALRGMDILVARKRRWFHAGIPTIQIGPSVQLDPSLTPEQSTATLHDIMQNLLQ